MLGPCNVTVSSSLVSFFRSIFLSSFFFFLLSSFFFFLLSSFFFLLFFNISYFMNIFDLYGRYQYTAIKTTLSRISHIYFNSTYLSFHFILFYFIYFILFLFVSLLILFYSIFRYGVLTANNVSAEYFVEAVSGIGITHSYGRPAGMPQYYSRMYLLMERRAEERGERRREGRGGRGRGAPESQRRRVAGGEEILRGWDERVREMETGWYLRVSSLLVFTRDPFDSSVLLFLLLFTLMLTRQLEQPTPLWNFKQWIPDAVTIHLGTNDIFTAENTSTVWIDTYVDFVGFIRAQYLKVGRRGM